MVSSDSVYNVPVEYFSYGSNLDRHTFETRFASWGGGKISYAKARRATLSGWRLAFNAYGLPPKDPVFASVEPAEKTEAVHGMLYRLDDKASWRGVLESEGAPQKFYDVVQVRVQVDGIPVDAVTLVVKPWFWVPPSLRANVRPSARYRDLIVAGAKAENLPADYIARIAGLPVTSEASNTMIFLGMVGASWTFSVSSVPIFQPLQRLLTIVSSRLLAAKEGNTGVAKVVASTLFTGFTCCYAVLGMAALPFNPGLRQKLRNEINKAFSRPS